MVHVAQGAGPGGSFWSDHLVEIIVGILAILVFGGLYVIRGQRARQAGRLVGSNVPGVGWSAQRRRASDLASGILGKDEKLIATCMGRKGLRRSLEVTGLLVNDIVTAPFARTLVVALTSKRFLVLELVKGGAAIRYEAPVAEVTLLQHRERILEDRLVFRHVEGTTIELKVTRPLRTDARAVAQALGPGR